MKYLDEKRDSSPNHLRRESHFSASTSFKDQHCLYGSLLLRPIFTYVTFNPNICQVILHMLVLQLTQNNDVHLTYRHLFGYITKSLVTHI